MEFKDTIDYEYIFERATTPTGDGFCDYCLSGACNAIDLQAEKSFKAGVEEGARREAASRDTGTTFSSG